MKSIGDPDKIQKKPKTNRPKTRFVLLSFYNQGERDGGKPINIPNNELYIEETTIQQGTKKDYLCLNFHLFIFIKTSMSSEHDNRYLYLMNLIHSALQGS